MDNFETKLNELISLLNEQEEVKRYKEIEAQLNNNKYIKDKIAAFKKLQQKMAIYEYNKNTLPEEVNAEYLRLFDELTNIPVFNEYLNLQEELNDLIKQITGIIEIELNK